MNRQEPFRGGGVPPESEDFSGPLCEDPACYRKRPHFPREYGCRWSNVCVYGKDGREYLIPKLVAVMLLLLCTSCVSVVRELKSGPFPVLLKHQARATGFEAEIPNQTGSTIVKVRFGFFSDSFYFVPCSTNKLYCAPIADDFTLGDQFSFTPSVQIKESSIFGWEGVTPPPARFQRLFSPKEGP